MFLTRPGCIAAAVAAVNMQWLLPLPSHPLNSKGKPSMAH